MKLKRLGWLLFFAAGLWGIGGCAGPAAVATATATVGVSADAIQVDRVEILQLATEPPQVRAVVSGELPNPCVQVDNVSLQQNGNQFVGTLVTSRLGNGACPATPVSFEKVVPLEGMALQAGSNYTLTVNGVSTSFEIAGGDSTGAPAEATPTVVALSAEASATPTPVQMQTPAQEAPTQQGCVDKAGFFGDVTIPDNTIFAPDETFVKTWRFRNEGTCTWTGYTLVFAGGDQMGGSGSTPIATVNPGDTFDVSISLEAPTRSGVYQGNWWFQNAKGERFGVNTHGKDLFWVKIVVSPPTSGSSNEATTLANCAYQTNADYESQVMNLINQARTSEGLSTLKPESRLKAAASEHSLDMACNDFVEHYGSDGQTYQTRVSNQGYRYSTVTENIYAGDPAFGGDPNGAFNWWMNSQIHRAAILNSKYTNIGIAYVFNAASQYGGYYTVVFARP
jgi:uncharacterized protein YkwD